MIPEIQVTCVSRDLAGEIVMIGSGTARWTVSEAISAIENHKVKFYTVVERKKAYVEVVTPWDRRKHLRTVPDETKRNNLELLPLCK